MAATPDTGEQFRIKLPGVDSSGVKGERARETEKRQKERECVCERKREIERASYGERNVEAQQVALSNCRGLPC